MNGGAIYISNPNARLELRGCTFSFNTAKIRGGAIYIENLETELVLTRDGPRQNQFVSNQAYAGGDALYVRNQKPPVLMRRLMEETQVQEAAIVIKHSEFKNPSGSGQLFFVNQPRLDFANLKFTEFKNTNAVQGGSIYCSNCLNVSIANSSFTD